ncbi:MAG: alpha/beta hydrolase [Planctomycetota bacterium]
MTRHRINYIRLFAVFTTALSLGPPLQAVDLPPELPLWDKPPQDLVVRTDVKEQVRSNKPRPGSPSGSNRVFSSVSSPTYSIHRPPNPNGVGLVICPGGGFRNVWIDREGHDLAIWLKDHGVTSLVLKYRTRLPNDKSSANAWQNYQRIVQADGRQAIRILRKGASNLGLRPDKIGICGFSAGGHLALTSALRAEDKPGAGQVSGMPDFAGLFYPGIPDDANQLIESRTARDSGRPDICPLFIMNARVDKLTPADKCVDLYAMLLKAGVNAELHVFGKGSHGFDMGTGAGKSAAIWPKSFAAWLNDCDIIHQ